MWQVPILIHVTDKIWCFITYTVKITCYLYTWKDRCCCGYFKKLLKWNYVIFHWRLYDEKNITWPHGDTKFFNTKGEISYPYAAMKYPPLLEECGSLLPHNIAAFDTNLLWQARKILLRAIICQKEKEHLLQLSLRVGNYCI